MPKIIHNEEERRTPYSVSMTRAVVELARTIGGSENLSESISRVIEAAGAVMGKLVEWCAVENGERIETRVVRAEARKLAEWCAEHKGAFPALREMLPEGVEVSRRVTIEELRTVVIPAMRAVGFLIQEIDVPDADYYAVWAAPGSLQLSLPEEEPKRITILQIRDAIAQASAEDAGTIARDALKRITELIKEHAKGAERDVDN